MMQNVGGRRCSWKGLEIASCLLVGGLSGHAVAQTETLQEDAQRYFTEGLRLMQSDHCEDAVPEFVKSQRIEPTAATFANLATCYARLGKTGSAYSTYLLAARAAILESKPDLQKRADRAATSLASRLTRLGVVPLGNGKLPAISINGQPVEDVRRPVPLDPGDNIIEATLPGRDPWRRTLSAQGAGTLMVVEVPDLTPPHESNRTEPPIQLSAKSLPLDESPRRVDLKPYALVAGGIGVVGIAVGTVLGVGARSKQSASNSYCNGHYCTQPGLDLRDQANDRAKLATWSLGIGLVSVGTAVALWFIPTRRSSQERSLSVTPWMTIGNTSAGVAVQGKL